MSIVSRGFRGRRRQPGPGLIPDLFGAGVRTPETQRLIERAMERGLQTRDGEMDLARMLSELGDPSHQSRGN